MYCECPSMYFFLESIALSIMFALHFTLCDWIPSAEIRSQRSLKSIDKVDFMIELFTK